MNLQEVGWGMDWVDLAQERDRWLAFVSAMTNLVSLNSGNCVIS